MGSQSDPLGQSDPPVSLTAHTPLSGFPSHLKNRAAMMAHKVLHHLTFLDLSVLQSSPSPPASSANSGSMGTAALPQGLCTYHLSQISTWLTSLRLHFVLCSSVTTERSSLTTPLKVNLPLLASLSTPSPCFMLIIFIIFIT